jgi:hypothetical protein
MMSEQRKIIPNIHSKVHEIKESLNQLGNALQPLSDAIYGNATKAMPEDANADRRDRLDRVQEITRPSQGGAFNELEEDVDRLLRKSQELVKTATELSSLILG